MSEISHQISLSVYGVRCRIDQYLCDVLRLSRSKIKNRIQEGAILWNGLSVRPSQIIQHQDKISLFIAPIIHTEQMVTELRDNVMIYKDWVVPILHMDDHVLVIQKPAGLVVHAGPTVNDVSLVDIVLASGICLPFCDAGRPGIVHRLDQFTEGVMVLAKTPLALDHLKAQFKDRKIQKRYYAVLHGSLPSMEGVIDRPIGRDASVRARQSCQNIVTGSEKEAITKYKVVNKLTNVSFVDIQLVTGRTHQIRVHFSYLNCPVLGDFLYSRQPKKKEGYLLQSYYLGFEHPLSNQCLIFKLPISHRLKKYAC